MTHDTQSAQISQKQDEHNSSCYLKISLDDDKNDNRFSIDIASCFKMDFVLKVVLKFTCT